MNSVLTPDTHREIVRLAGVGCDEATIEEALGLESGAVEDWTSRDGEPYAALERDVAQARARARVRDEATIAKAAAKGNVAAAKHRLDNGRRRKKGTKPKGRKYESTLTPALAARIVARVKAGARPEVAARAEGVPKPTYYRWRDHARSADTRESWQCYRDLFAEIDQADASAELTIADTAINEEKAAGARWFLERRWRERYGHEIKIQVRDEVQEDLIERLREGLDPETYRRVLACLVGGEGGEGARESGGDGA